MGVIQPAGQMIHFTGQAAWNENEEMVDAGFLVELAPIAVVPTERFRAPPTFSVTGPGPT